MLLKNPWKRALLKKKSPSQTTRREAEAEAEGEEEEVAAAEALVEVAEHSVASVM